MASRKKPAFTRSSSIDDQFDAFLKASMGSDSDTSLSKYIQPKKKKEKPWWQSSVETSEEFDTQKDAGLGTFGKSFLKKKPKSIIPPIAPKTPDGQTPSQPSPGAAGSPGTVLSPLKDHTLRSQHAEDITTGPFSARASGAEPGQRSSRLFTETDEFRESQLSFDQSTETAQETLGEAADKSRFFKKLAEEADETLDYSKMNKQLGDSGNTSFFDTVAKRPAAANNTLSPHIEEFADDGRPPTFQGNEPPSEPEHFDEPDLPHYDEPDLPNRPNLLANVSLNDTLDTSLQATTAPTADQSGGMGNTSQMDYDAVQQAYQEVHDKEVTVHSLPFATRREEPVNESEEFTEETDRHTDEAPVWQNTSRRDGESDGTSVWDLQPVPEVQDVGEHRTPPRSMSPSPPVSRRDSAAAPTSTPQKDAPAQSIWDLEPVYQSELPPELTPIAPSRSSIQTDDQVDFGSGRLSPPTAVGYQTIDRLSPIQQELAFPSPTVRDSQTNTPPRGRHRKSLGKTQTLRRPTSASNSADKFSHVKSSGYGVVHQTPVRDRSASPKFKPSAKKWAKKRSPSSAKHQSAVNEAEESIMAKESSPVKVLQSIESFANYLRDQFVSSTPASKIEAPYFPTSGGLSAIHSDREASLMNEVREWQQKWREECRMREKLSADFMAAQRHWERYSEDSRLKQEQELGKLRQQVYILESSSSESAGKANKPVNGTISKLEAEIQSQEKLISGYQLENEKLYTEMRQADSLHKATYERLYEENHKQAAELAKLRELMSRKDAELRVKALNPLTTYAINQPMMGDVRSYQPINSEIERDTPMTAALGAGRIAELKSQLIKSKGDVGALAASVTVLTNKNSNLDTHLQNVTKERDELKELLFVSKQPAELRVIQERYQQEINVLEKRIRWYIDNQRLLDTDVERLREKDCKINHLTNQVKQLEEQKARTYDGVQRTKDRAADAKRIKDLERQVKEMEQIIRKRNPNSIPSLIWAASVMPDAPENKPPSMKYLEERVAKLEEELAGKDEDTSRLLRAMEQQCNQSKIVYEQRIADLQSELSKGSRVEPSRHTTVSALEKDLQAAREQHRKRQQELQATIDSLREEISRLRHQSAVELKCQTRALRQSCDQSEHTTAELHHQLNVKLADIAALHDAVDRLQKEKRQLLVELNHIQSSSPRRETVVQSSRSPAKKPVNAPDSKTRVVPSSSPRKKDYEATEFSAEHISDVIAMNKSLAVKYEESQIEISQLRVDHQRRMSHIETQMRQEQTEIQSQLKEKEKEHQKERDQLVAQYALKQSDNDVSKYKNEINSLQTVIRHLKEDRQRWQADSEELSALRIRNITLDSRIRRLEDLLEDAKEHHTPEMRHFERLRDKIANMEERFSAREVELKRVITQNQVTYREDLRLEVLKWKNVVQTKNSDIERFRSELDAILGVLKELRRQGVTIPLTT